MVPLVKIHKAIPRKVDILFIHIYSRKKQEPYYVSILQALVLVQICIRRHRGLVIMFYLQQQMYCMHAYLFYSLHKFLARVYTPSREDFTCDRNTWPQGDFTVNLWKEMYHILLAVLRDAEYKCHLLNQGHAKYSWDGVESVGVQLGKAPPSVLKAHNC